MKKVTMSSLPQGLVGLALPLMLMSSAALANQNLVFCADDRAMDAGLEISITQLEPDYIYVRRGDVQAVIIAEISERTIAGTRSLALLAVREARSNRIGAATHYLGKGFDLEVNWTASPLPQGGHLGHLTAEVNGQRLSQDLNCRLPKS